MLDVQHLFSMPSTLVSDHYNSNTSLPPLTQLRDFDWNWHKSKHPSRAGNGEITDFAQGSERGAAGHQHGLRTPPREMTGTAHNTQTLPGNSVPVVTSNAPPYPTPQHRVDGQSRRNSKTQPFYKSYYSARPAPSPGLGRDIVAERGQSARRKASNDGNSIASYLQIPPSINDSKGSLPEFAAQITCLFWFESSVTLSLVEDSSSSPTPAIPLSPEAVPTTGFRKWVTTILSMTQVSQNVILLALMFIYRLKKLNPSVKGKLGSEFRLLTVALMLGNKFLDDNTYTNKTWAEVSGISVQEIHVMEVEFLSNMRYTLYASEAEWNEWHGKLGRFSDYFDKASQARTETSFQSLAPLASSFNLSPKLPSPPASQKPSPPFLSRSSPFAPTALEPLSVTPYLAPPGPSSAPPLPDDSRNWARKRSLEDYSSERPTKRLSSYNTSATSSSALTPSVLRDPSSSVPRLPMPNFSVSTGTQSSGHGPSSGQLPLPAGRAMSTVFPGPNRWPQNGMLPPLQAPQYLSHQGSSNSSSPTNEHHRRHCPYPHGSRTPSPTNYHFSHHIQTPNGLSPSGVPMPRNSPYKPIRGVNTLLVPPPSASMHNPPLHLSYDQMHYQPLGKPITERKTGVLPYLPFDTYAQAPHVQPYLPQPHFT